MRKRIVALTLSVLTLISICGCASSAEDGATPYAPISVSGEITEKTEEFAVRSAGELLTGEDNFCYSPISLYFALAMASSGAEGETLAQMNDALGAVDHDTLAADCAGLYNALIRDDELTKLYLANSVWTRKDIIPKDAYEQRLREDYHAEAFRVDFTDAKTDEKMANWVSEKTQGLLKPRFQHAVDTTEVLLNTVYFKAQWDAPFRGSLTELAPFTSADGSEGMVLFMHAADVENGYVSEQYTRVSRSFAGGGHMTFLLPNEGTTLAELLRQNELRELLDESGDEAHEVEWSVPVFGLDSEIDLIPMLKRLGITDAFDVGKADFSSASDTPASIGSVHQGTRLSVDEKGVEAAAYTEIVKDEAGLMVTGDTIVMDLNRPFLYAVRDKNGVLLFVGVCADLTEYAVRTQPILTDRK